MTNVTAASSNAIAVISILLQIFVPGLAPPGSGQSLPRQDDRLNIRILFSQLLYLFLSFSPFFPHTDIAWVVSISHNSRSAVSGYLESVNRLLSSSLFISVSHFSPPEAKTSPASRAFSSSIVSIFSSMVPRVINLWTITFFS